MIDTAPFVLEPRKLGQSPPLEINAGPARPSTPPLAPGACWVRTLHVGIRNCTVRPAVITSLPHFLGYVTAGLAGVDIMTDGPCRTFRCMSLVV